MRLPNTCTINSCDGVLSLTKPLLLAQMEGFVKVCLIHGSHKNIQVINKMYMFLYDASIDVHKIAYEMNGMTQYEE